MTEPNPAPLGAAGFVVTEGTESGVKAEPEGQSQPVIQVPKHASQNLRRTVLLGGRKTSVCLEHAFWQSIKETAGVRNAPIYKLIAAIDAEREHTNLSSAIRVYVLNFYQNQT